jgi:hypothetical protein
MDAVWWRVFCAPTGRPTSDVAGASIDIRIADPARNTWSKGWICTRA